MKKYLYKITIDNNGFTMEGSANCNILEDIPSCHVDFFTFKNIACFLTKDSFTGLKVRDILFLLIYCILWMF